MKNVKRKRRMILYIVILVFVILIIWNLFQKKNYTISYTVNNYAIEESYVKDTNHYFFRIMKDNKEYYAMALNSHFMNKKLIYQIDEYSSDNETCLVLHSNQIPTQDVCMRDDIQISPYLVNDELKGNLGLSDSNHDLIDTYENVSIYNNNYSYYLWNYKGFYQINKNGNQTISFFNKDIYSPSLMTQVKHFIFIPDYGSDYYFSRVYILDMDTGKYVTWNLDHSIYFDSTILGVYQDNIYLVDKHEKVEWKIDIQKQSMEKIGTESNGGKIYQSGWQNVTMSKLIYQDASFNGYDLITYTMDNGLYFHMDDHQILMREDNPSMIVQTNEDNVFYLVKDKLYHNSLTTGEELMASYFEWNFNSSNMIFIAS